MRYSLPLLREFRFSLALHKSIGSLHSQLSPIIIDGLQLRGALMAAVSGLRGSKVVQVIVVGVSGAQPYWTDC